MAKHKIALIPGDGIGKEVVPEGVRVLEAAARRFGFELEFTDYDWSCDRFAKTGKMMPDDGMEHAEAVRERSSSARSAGRACPTTSRCGAC